MDSQGVMPYPVTLEDDADLMAGVMRILIELKFWAHFVSDSPERATQFISETETDARELF
jgi:hypothetical protein